jgi:hypothetical protein
VDWGIFNAPRRNDRADAPHMVQTEGSMNPRISTNFNMSDGGITSLTPDGIITGVSNNVLQENGYLSFTPVESTPSLAPIIGVYCILVSTEKLVFL